MDLSKEPEANKFPQGEIASALIVSVCPSNSSSISKLLSNIMISLKLLAIKC